MKRTARFAISSAAVDGAVALVGGAELHHMRDVMRLMPGAEVALFDERGAEYAGTIRSFQARHAVIEIAAATRARAEATAGLILAAAVIKGPRMDFLVEKAAELGAAELWPVLCTRGVVREVGGERLARWRRLAMAAAKQSLAPRAMLMQEPLSFADLIRTA
ncbi:MAG: RsmE family RNA methyltransferase, partial [Candidatus Binataceae bacterium]